MKASLFMMLSFGILGACRTATPESTGGVPEAASVEPIAVTLAAGGVT